MSEENTKQKLYEQEERNARLWNMIHWLLSRCSDHERSLFNQDFAEPTTIKVLVPMPPVCAIYTDGEEKKSKMSRWRNWYSPHQRLPPLNRWVQVLAYDYFSGITSGRGQLWGRKLKYAFNVDLDKGIGPADIVAWRYLERTKKR